MSEVVGAKMRELDDDDQMFDSQSVRNAFAQRNTGRDVGVSWFNYYFLTCLSSKDAVNDHGYSVILEEAGQRGRGGTEQAQVSRVWTGD